MNTHRRSPAAWLSACLLALLLGLSPAHAQGQETYSEAELASLLAPIALYPDALLSQILMASTYPLEVVEAARWSRRNPGLEGSAAVDAVADMDWDPSVKALVAFPRVIQQMSDDLTWTRQVGDAFLLQEEDLADMVQELRQRAYDAGHLEDREHVRVVREREVIYIEPASPRVVYVPYYQPTIVYGGWWWPAYAPVYWGPPYGYSVSIGITWVSGVPVSRSFFYSGFNWTHRHVVIIHHYDYRTRHYVPAGHRWRHDPWHRRGVAYRHHAVHQRYGESHYSQRSRAERPGGLSVPHDSRRSDWQGRRDVERSRDGSGPARLAPRSEEQHARSRDWRTDSDRPRTERSREASGPARPAPRSEDHQARSRDWRTDAERPRTEHRREAQTGQRPSLGSAPGRDTEQWRQQRRSGDATAQAPRERTRTGPVTDDTRRSINSRELHQGHSDRIREGWSREGQNRPRQEAQQPSRPAWNANGETGRAQVPRSPQGERDGGWRGQGGNRDPGWQGGRRDGNLGRGDAAPQPGFRAGQPRGEGRHSFAR